MPFSLGRTPTSEGIAVLVVLLAITLVLSAVFWYADKLFRKMDRVIGERTPAELTFFELYTPCFIGIIVGWFFGLSDGVVGALAPVSIIVYATIKAIFDRKESSRHDDGIGFPSFKFKVTYLVVFTFFAAFVLGATIGGYFKERNNTREIRLMNLSEICVSLYSEAEAWMNKNERSILEGIWGESCRLATGHPLRKNFPTPSINPSP